MIPSTKWLCTTFPYIFSNIVKTFSIISLSDKSSICFAKLQFTKPTIIPSESSKFIKLLKKIHENYIPVELK